MHTKLLILLFFIGFSLCTQAEVKDSKDSDGIWAFNYINHLRSKAGMKVLSKNTLLDKAALNHASYCHTNLVGGHFEAPEKIGFTGYDHVERLNAVGYNSRSTGENVSFHKGEVNDKNSVDGLMAAIYHRFGFLSFEYDEIGIGKIQGDNYGSFVYNMGNISKNSLCLAGGSKISGKFYSAICRDKQIQISAKEFDLATFKTQQDNPAVVVWPAPDSSDVPPAFFEESPDPLPDYSVSGYPISIQFNPSVFPDVKPVVMRFELIDLQTGLPLELIRRIDKNTDQHKKFSDYEHAIFPRQRLGWFRQYRAEVDYVVDGVRKSIVWTFDTRSLNVPIYEVRKDNTVIKEKSAKEFAVYVPPKNRNDTDLAYSTKYRGLSDLDIKILDGNTLMVKATGDGEAIISFHGLTFRIEI